MEQSEASDCVVYLVGNKSDLSKPEVNRAEGEALARQFGVKFFTTSARDNQGIQDAFASLAKDMEIKMMQRKRISASDSNPGTTSKASTTPIRVTKTPAATKQSCC